MVPRSRPLAALLALVLAASFAVGTASANGNDDNRGTIKVHDDEDADPDPRNEPHVSCDFWVQGFNMHDAEGVLKFYAWPPTGDKSIVTPTGDDLAWEGTPDGDGEYDFLSGAYQLPVGHYRVEAWTTDDHPGHTHFAKAKMFWVDPCAEGCEEDCNPPTPTPTPTPPTTPPADECPEDVPADECVPIPFFPGPIALALGALGATGSALMIARRRS